MNPIPTNSPIVRHETIEWTEDQVKQTTHVDSKPQDILNWRERQKSNGWTKDRSMRKLGSIPVEIYSRLPPEIRCDDAELKKWMKAHPEMCTADCLTF